MDKFENKGKIVQGSDPSKKENHRPKPPFPSVDDRMNLKEVAELFGKSPQTILNWKKKNLIPYFQLNKSSRPFYSRSQLIELASKNQHLFNK